MFRQSNSREIENGFTYTIMTDYYAFLLSKLKTSELLNPEEYKLLVDAKILENFMMENYTMMTNHRIGKP